MTNAWALRPLVPAAVTASATAAGYDPAYVANDQAGVVWKSPTGASSRTLTVDLGSAQAPDAALFFGCTGATTGWTLAVEAANSADFGTDLWSGGAAAQFLAGAEMPAHGRGVGLWIAGSAPPARRYWRFTFASLSNAAVTIARLALGQRMLLERNFGFGAAFGLRDLGKVDFSSTGVFLRRRGAKLRTVGITFAAVHKDEAETKVLPLLELVAGQEPIALVTDPDAHALRQRRCYFGPLVGELGMIWRVANGWEWRANLVDLIPIPKAA